MPQGHGLTVRSTHPYKESSAQTEGCAKNLGTLPPTSQVKGGMHVNKIIPYNEAEMVTADSDGISASEDHSEQILSTSEDHIKHRSWSSFSRRGTEITIDESLCPYNSLAVHPMQAYEPPEHKDCPTLFIVGARKGGSTSLYQYVSKHPNFKGINLDLGRKAGETMFFSHKGHNAESWQQYLNLFPKDGSMSGESSVANLVDCNVPQRILKACGKDTKIVMLFRNPVNRFESNYLMRSTRGYNGSSAIVNKELTEFLNESDLSEFDLVNDWTKLLCIFRPAKNMVFEGLYYVHLYNWLCNFPRENILVVNTEEFFANTTEILGQVLDFVGLKPLKENLLKAITSKVYNMGKNSIHPNLRLSIVDRERLLQVYEPFNKALFGILGWKTVEWN